MPAKYLLSLDFGGSGGRAELFNLETGAISISTCAWGFDPAPMTGGFGYDLGCDSKWQALCQVARQVMGKSTVRPDEVAGISVTSMRHGMVMIDRHGQPLIATPNKDARAITEGMELAERYGGEIYRRTGHYPNPVIMAARLVWVKNNHPEWFDAAQAVLTISDWMAFKLSGVAATEPTQAGETCLFDLRAGDWAKDLIQSLGIPPSIFPNIVNPGTKLGGLTEQAAADLGLIPGIPVAAGGADTQLGLLALGITAPEQVGVIAGSTTPTMVTTSKPVVDPKQRTWTGMYAIPGIYVVESNAGGMGTALEWAAGLFYPDSPSPVAALSGDAANSIPGASGVFSTLGAQLFNCTALSIPIDGMTFSSMTVPSGPLGRAHLSRSILEGMAFGVRANVEQSCEVANSRIDRVHIGGGMTRSSLWNQIVADVFGHPAVIGYGQSTTGFGAILCAAVGAGLYTDLQAAIQALVKDTCVVEPSPSAEAYQELYQSWREYQQQRGPADEIAQNTIMQAMQASMGGETSSETQFRPKIYVSANVGEDAIRMLRELGDVTYASYADQGTILSGEELAETLAGYQVLVTEVDLVDAVALQKAKDLRVVVACRGNPVNVDIPACTAAGIPVINTPGRNADAVADLTISFMLMLARKLDKATSFLKEPGGEAGDMGRMGAAYFNFKGNELWQKTVGLIGGGAIGKKVTRRLLPFGAQVLIYDPYLSAEEAALVGATRVSYEELLERSDFISLHAAVTEETTGMVDAAAFARMKPGAFLINTARAALIDHDALLDALGSGKLGGAAFDVFPVEPPASDDPLLAFDNVIATPHIGGNTSEVGIHQGAIIVEELKRMLAGENPRYALNPETLASFQWTGKRIADQAALTELSKGPGPAVSDLDLKAKQEQASSVNLSKESEHEKPASGGLLRSLKNLIGGKGKETVPAAAESAPVQSDSSTERFARIIDQFLKDLAQDANAQAFARKNKVSFQFVIKGTEITFFMGFGDGRVTTGIGDPLSKPDVTVKVDMDTFDGMFTGKLDGNQAFKSGKLTVSGNMLKAMALQKLDFGPIYARNRDALGGLISAPVPASKPAEASPPASAPAAPALGAAPATPSFDKFNRIIERFLEMMNQDEATQAFAKGKNVSFQYNLKDAGTAFYMSFVNGKVEAGMGEFPGKADVNIKTTAETIDGLFTGRLDGTAAFKSGKLSVGGNMMKAIVMQKLDFSTLYQKARSEIGDPGLTAASPVQGKPHAAGQTPGTPPAPVGQQIAVPNVIHKVGDIRDQILDINNEMYLKGWITSTGGNISARSETNPEEIWITPSAIFKGNLRADYMVKINLDGEISGDAQFNASSERRVHCAIYRARPDVRAVIHTHAIYSTLMGLTGSKWLPISADAAFFGQIPVVPFIMPGSPELGDEVAAAIGKKGIAVIMQNHGLVVAGSDLRRAADTTEAIEITAEKLLWCQKLGIPPATIPDDIVSILGEMGAMIA